MSNEQINASQEEEVNNLSDEDLTGVAGGTGPTIKIPGDANGNVNIGGVTVVGDGMNIEIG
jgi:hypothetical protein